jgi:hypothetical protein
VPPPLPAGQGEASGSALPVGTSIGGALDGSESDDNEPVDGEIADPAGAPPGDRSAGDLFSLG